MSQPQQSGIVNGINVHFNADQGVYSLVHPLEGGTSRHLEQLSKEQSDRISSMLNLEDPIDKLVLEIPSILTAEETPVMVYTESMDQRRAVIQAVVEFASENKTAFRLLDAGTSYLSEAEEDIAAAFDGPKTKGGPIASILAINRFEYLHPSLISWLERITRQNETRTMVLAFADSKEKVGFVLVPFREICPE